MARCEDFPCCGHEQGCCPNYDESGRQTDMVCVCGARLPIDNRYSCCDSCLKDNDNEEDERYNDNIDEQDDDDYNNFLQEELESFEQADDYFNHSEYNDWE